MKSALLALAVLGLPALPVERAVAQTQIERLREACLSTDMQREAFERLLGARGLTELIPVVRAGQPGPTDWMSGYEDGGVQIVMSGKPEVPALATDCGVLDPHPQDDWRADVTALAGELGMQSDTPVGLAGAIDARSWRMTDGRSLTLNYEVYRGGVVVRFAQSVNASD